MDIIENENAVPILEYAFLDRGDTKLEYEVSGNGTGEPLVLLSGNGGDYHCFGDTVYPCLAEHFRIIRFSTRGTGETLRGEKRLTFELFSEDLKLLLDHLGIKCANIYGFSDGGNLGVVFTLLYPSYVKRLCIMGANINTFGTKTLDQIGILRDHRVYAIKAALKKDGELALKRDIEGMMVGQPSLRYSDLSKIHMPFLNIFGEHDMIKRRHSRRITRAVDGGEEIIVLGGGHGSSFNKRGFLLEPVLLHFFGVN